jgi:hypothetical protein
MYELPEYTMNPNGDRIKAIAQPIWNLTIGTIEGVLNDIADIIKAIGVGLFDYHPKKSAIMNLVPSHANSCGYNLASLMRASLVVMRQLIVLN